MKPVAERERQLASARSDSVAGADETSSGFSSGAESGDAYDATVVASELVDASPVHVIDRLGGEDGLGVEHAGRYELVGELGEGGIGRVYTAYDAFLERRVAFKVLHDEARGQSLPAGATARTPVEIRFVNEARITGQLEHPGIVPVYELGKRSDETVYYTMRLVKGRSLEDGLQEATSVAARLELLPHFVDLCNTMAYAHSRGVVHRDLKPENVMLGDFGETVVLDWGLAKVQGEADIQEGALEDELERLKQQTSIKTVAGIPIGTPGYMPPEQALGQLSQVDERSDVYSLGVILYQLITGKLPFDGANAKEVIDKLLDETAPPADEVEPDCPPELAAIVRRAMQKNPKRRYADAGALATDVRAFMSGGIVGAHRYGLRARLRRWFAAHRYQVLAATALILVALGAWLLRGFEVEAKRQQELTAARKAAVAEVDRVMVDVAEGNVQERWLDVFTFRLLSLRNPDTSDAVDDELIAALSAESPEVRRLAARTLGAVKSDAVVEALVARLAEGVESSQEVQIEVINSLGVIGDPRAEEPVRDARWRAKQYSTLWMATELAYRMIPLPELEADGAALTAEDWNRRGNALVWKNRADEAVSAFDRAIEADPKDPRPYNNRAIQRRRLGDFAGALSDYNTVLELEPGDVASLNNRALLLRVLEDYDGALRDIDAVVAADGPRPRTLRNRAMIKRFQGDMEGSLADLARALEVQPGDARTYSAMAAYWRWNGDWDQALRALDQAVELERTYTHAILQRSTVHWVMGHRDAARADVDRVLVIDPTNNLGRRIRANIFMHSGHHERARQDLGYCIENQCISDHARRALRHAQRAVVLHARLGQYDEALADLRTSLVDDPRTEDAFVYRLLTVAVARQARDDARERAAVTALDDRDDRRLWYHRVAEIVTKERSYDEVVAASRGPIRLCAVHLAGGLAAERAGRPGVARQRYRRAAAVGEPFELACIMASILGER